MKYFILAILVLVGCSNDDKPVVDPALVYSAKSEHITIEGYSKVDAVSAKTLGAVNQMVIDAFDKP